jgi:20S proteasome alpha/beta subunit
MSLYQSLREPPILTAIIGAKCSDGIVLVADAKISRMNDEKLESIIKKKIAGDRAHFLMSYTGPKLTFDIFRKFIVGDLLIDLATNTMRFDNHIERVSNCINEINKVAASGNKIEILAVSHVRHNSVLYHVYEDGCRCRIEDYVSIGSGQEIADDFCKSLSHSEISMKTFATEAFLAIKFMEQNRPDLRVGGPPTVQYMDYNKEWDDEASSEDINEFEQYAKKHLKKLDRRMKSIAARSKRELMTEKTNNSS